MMMLFAKACELLGVVVIGAAAAVLLSFIVVTVRIAWKLAKDPPCPKCLARARSSSPRAGG